MNKTSEKKAAISEQAEQNRTIDGMVSIASVVQNVSDRVSGAADSNKGYHGLSTGFLDLDRIIRGLSKSEVIMVAGRPGMGTTTLVLNMALHAGLGRGKNVAIFSLEMSKEEMVSRMLSRAALIPYANIQSCMLNDRQQRDFADAAQALSNARIHIDDTPTLTISDMISKCQRIQNLDLVIINYLQLIQASGNDSDCCRMLKSMATGLHVPVICTANLSGNIEFRQDKRPMLSDLRESGIIEQYADVVIGLYRDSYYNKQIETPYLTEAIVLKNNRGASGTVYLNWLPEYMTFSSIEHDHDQGY